MFLSTKNKYILTILLFSSTTYLFAQDGSNIKYVEPDQLDNSFIGKYCHVDFGKESFGGRSIDTLEIKVNAHKMKFYEHRKDNGLNNWFDEQYLIRIDDNNQTSTRLQNTQIDSLNTDKIYVTSVLSYYVNESVIDTVTIFQHSYDRSNISKVLIKD
ncbi:hypothetical protein MY04_4393 [Flammeovirga sp. MY04]|uniref:hypothetical protein n=1 Tax=Flammeovirga sp. MY04 TaxID=1191459 RepID=UPI00080615A5|nr:hypothetical protein [Flammeovirga sp. MY04]ANQ51731.1 hypothetical protein MY04_4393 [Flammeovirga sp. MY04]